MADLLGSLLANDRIKPWMWVLVGAFLMGVYANRTAAALDHGAVDSIQQRLRDIACAQAPAKARAYCR